jgi:AraC family transcriptional regulator of adaptative response/methylated-DNA-[protein]-cysteine methyltransferase
MAPSTPSPVLLRAFETPLGRMLGGATAAGVCLCEFADRGGEERILARLEKRLGHPVEPSEPGTAAGVDGASPQAGYLDQLERQLREYFQGERREFDLPLELDGTPWQRKVWGALLEIPYGATTSYGELAARLGKPGGSRAVGRANGENSVAIVVPCHRVIQSDGGLRGYGGGLHRKRWLLDLEAGVRQLPF